MWEWKRRSNSRGFSLYIPYLTFLTEERCGPISAGGSPPYPTDDEVLSFYCPSCSQFCCLQNQTPPLVSLSLSPHCMLFITPPPSIFPETLQVAGPLSVSLTISIDLAPPLTPACVLSVFYFPTLDEQNRYSGKEPIALRRCFSTDDIGLTQRATPSLGGVAGWFPWQQLHGHDCCETVDSKFVHAGISSHFCLTAAVSAFLKSTKPIRSSSDIHTG